MPFSADLGLATRQTQLSLAKSTAWLAQQPFTRPNKILRLFPNISSGTPVYCLMLWSTC